MKKLAFLALAVAAAACSSSGQESTETTEAVSPPLPQLGVSTSQLQALSSLQIRTQQTWTLTQHEVYGTPMHLSASRTSGAQLLTPNGDAFKATLDLLADHKDLFKMHDPSSELSPTRVEGDRYGLTHARFQQVTHGVPVSGAELYAHYDSEGKISSINATYVPNLDRIDVQPKLDVNEAYALVKAHVLTVSEIDANDLKLDGEGKLVVYAPAIANVEPRLAYEFKVRAIEAKDPAIWVTTVDAKTGEILHKYNNFQTVQGSGTGALGNQKTFQVAQSGSGFLMTDASTGVQIKTYSAKNAQTTPGTQLTSTSATSWDTGVAGAGAAVDAHFNASVVYKYYITVHKRSGIDGAGGAMLSTSHFGSKYDNAAWDSTGMLYGDGGELFKPLSASVDVVGHEFTHGVTEKSSALVYDTQSGALNEAISDIFGAFIEHSSKPDAKNNWIMGELIVRSGPPLRDMAAPEAGADPQPSNMKTFVNTTQDNGGVHTNSGIINNAAFLMTVGGTNPVSKTKVAFGIGWEKSEALWYQANTKHFTSTTNFGGAAQGILESAKDIGLTDNETAIVDCAFKATGIAQGTCGAIVDPQATVPDPTSADPGDADAGAADPAETPKPPTKKRKIVTTHNGCNAAGAATDGGRDLGPFAALAAVVLGLASRKKKKKKS